MPLAYVDGQEATSTAYMVARNDWALEKRLNFEDCFLKCDMWGVRAAEFFFQRRKVDIDEPLLLKQVPADPMASKSVLLQTDKLEASPKKEQPPPPDGHGGAD